MTSDETFEYTYDAWNRPAKVTQKQGAGETTVGQYEYNGLGHRIKAAVTNRGEPEGTQYFYYNHKWKMFVSRLQLLESRRV